MSDSALGWIIVLGIVVTVHVISKEKGRKLAAARRAYLSHPELLKAEPWNPDLRQRTLDFGRAYANLTRDKKGVAVFDEVAIMNDLNAATAGVSPRISTDGTPLKDDSTVSRLRRLSDLVDRKLISSDDYERTKERILSEV